MGAEQGHGGLLETQQRTWAGAGGFVVTGEKLRANEQRDEARQMNCTTLIIKENTQTYAGRPQ